MFSEGSGWERQRPEGVQMTILQSYNANGAFQGPGLQLGFCLPRAGGPANSGLPSLTTSFLSMWGRGGGGGAIWCPGPRPHWGENEPAKEARRVATVGESDWVISVRSETEMAEPFR